jgi:hypothetical protein
MLSTIIQQDVRYTYSELDKTGEDAAVTYFNVLFRHKNRILPLTKDVNRGTSCRPIFKELRILLFIHC